MVLRGPVDRVCGRFCFRAWTAPLIALAALTTFSETAAADPIEAPQGREIWAGADVSTDVWLVYSGVTFAPWSAIHDEGFRFRAAGGYGEYRYDRSQEKLEKGLVSQRPIQFHAETYFADFLVGYLKRFGELTAKAFVGASVISHEISPNDTETIAIGDETGIKGVIELWLNIGESGWGSLDLSWASAHDTRAARARLGYRLWPKLSVGLEAGINVDAQGECRVKAEATGECGYVERDGDKIQRIFGGKPEQADLLDYARGGGFVRYEWGRSEMSLSAGILGESFGNEKKIELAPYVTINWLTQF